VPIVWRRPIYNLPHALNVFHRGIPDHFLLNQHVIKQLFNKTILHLLQTQIDSLITVSQKFQEPPFSANHLFQDVQGTFDQRKPAIRMLSRYLSTAMNECRAGSLLLSYFLVEGLSYRSSRLIFSLASLRTFVRFCFRFHPRIFIILASKVMRIHSPCVLRCN
jgi:hypothetical protein